MIVALGDIYGQIPRREEVRELMLATQERVRKQPGCISYEFAETLDDPAHFVVLQRWRDQEALDEHYRSDAFVRYQEGMENRLVRTSELHVYVVQESFLPLDSSVINTAHDD